LDESARPRGYREDTGDLMRPQRLADPTIVSVFVQQSVEFTTIELTPVCFQVGEAFEVTVCEE
jgi:hypothetical protein